MARTRKAPPAPAETPALTTVREIVTGNEALTPLAGRLLLKLAQRHADVIANNSEPVRGWAITRGQRAKRDLAEADRLAQVQAAERKLAAIGTLASGPVRVETDHDVLTDGYGEWDFNSLSVGTTVPTEAGDVHLSVSTSEFGGTQSVASILDERREIYVGADTSTIPDVNERFATLRDLYRLASQDPGAPQYQYPPAAEDQRALVA